MKSASFNKREFNLKEFFSIVRKRFWIIAMIVIFTTLLGGFYNYVINTPLYESSSRIIIGATPELRNTLQVIIKDTVVLEKVVDQLELNTTPEELADKINVSSVDNSQVVSIKVTDSNPKSAANIANTTALVFKNEISNIVDFKDVRFLSRAKVNSLPINDNLNHIIIISAFIGIILGIGFVLLLDSLDETIRDELDVEALVELPLLGKVSKIKKRNLKRKGIHRKVQRSEAIDI